MIRELLITTLRLYLFNKSIYPHMSAKRVMTAVIMLVDYFVKLQEGPEENTEPGPRFKFAHNLSKYAEMITKENI